MLIELAGSAKAVLFTVVQVELEDMHGGSRIYLDKSFLTPI